MRMRSPAAVPIILPKDLHKDWEMKNSREQNLAFLFVHLEWTAFTLGADVGKVGSRSSGMISVSRIRLGASQVSLAK